jgi:hypothetical protein
MVSTSLGLFPEPSPGWMRTITVLSNRAGVVRCPIRPEIGSHRSPGGPITRCQRSHPATGVRGLNTSLSLSTLTASGCHGLASPASHHSPRPSRRSPAGSGRAPPSRSKAASPDSRRHRAHPDNDFLMLAPVGRAAIRPATPLQAQRDRRKVMGIAALNPSYACTARRHSSVGWVERSDTHQSRPINPDRSTR